MRCRMCRYIYGINEMQAVKAYWGKFRGGGWGRILEKEQKEPLKITDPSRLTLYPATIQHPRRNYRDLNEADDDAEDNAL